MSSSESDSSGDSGPGRREVAHRLFATEFDAATLEYADSDEERAPKYVITPTGARVNRLFVAGVLTEVQRVNDDVVRARVVDPTGAFVVYAGQYQPDALAFLERADPPTFVALTGKANTFRPEDSDRVYTSVRPESVAEVDAETRDRWTVQAAEHTLRRVGEFARALEAGADDEPALVEAGFDPERARGIVLAREEYGTTPAYLAALRETAFEAARLVAGEVEGVTAPAIDPGGDDGRAVDLADLQGAEVLEPAVEADEPETGAAEATGDTTETSEPDATAGGLEAGEAESVEDTAEAPSEAGEPETGDVAVADIDEDGSDDLGNFDVGESESLEADPERETETGVNVDPSDEDELYEFDPEERAEIESEFDMEFSSGSEVGEPGEAGIDVPEPETVSEEPDQEPEETGTIASEAAEPEPDVEPAEPEVEPEPDAGGVEAEPEASDVDVEDRAMEVMRELADGDGADRDAVVERVVDEHGVDPAAVDDAIESALLSGRCYEPQDGVLKPI